MEKKLPEIVTTLMEIETGLAEIENLCKGGL